MQDSVRLTCLSCGQANRVPVAKFDAGPKCPKCAKPLVGGDVVPLGIKLHDIATQKDGLPLVVDYWAPWCGPCRMMASAFAAAAKAVQYKARFAKIDTEQFPALSQRLEIRGIPLLILYANGHEVARLSGARPEADIKAFVMQYI